MADPKNFLNQKTSIFSDRSIDAARAGCLANGEVLLRQLDRAMVVAQGAAEVLALQQANQLQTTTYEDRQPGEEIEPPVSEYSISVLSSLAQFACESLASELEHTSTWLDQHGIAPARGGSDA